MEGLSVKFQEGQHLIIQDGWIQGAVKDPEKYLKSLSEKKAKEEGGKIHEQRTR